MRLGILVMGVAVLIGVGALPASASVRCKGVSQFEDGTLRARFRCHYREGNLRRLRATCRDGEPGCDADGACDGACRFSLCSDASCGSTFDVTVPLRRGGAAKRRRVLRLGRTKAVLRCLPSHGACGPTLTTTSTVATTTLPSPCSVTLRGAVDASATCNASFSTGGLGLPVLHLGIDGTEVEGVADALLLGRGSGTYRLGQQMLLMVAQLSRPDAGYFQALPGASGAGAELRIDAVAGDAVHGSLDATLPSQAGGEALRLQAEF